MIFGGDFVVVVSHPRCDEVYWYQYRLHIFCDVMMTMVVVVTAMTMRRILLLLY